MAIYIMRHGQSVPNIEKRISGRTPEGDLTDIGRDQARRAAFWLADKGITRIVSSPLHRAEQTAAIVGQYLQLVPEIDMNLREFDCGIYEGLNDEVSLAAWLNIFLRWKAGDIAAEFPEGECYADVRDRYLRALRRAKSEENTLMVTHGGIAVSILPFLCVNAAALQGVPVPANAGFVVLSPYDATRFECEAWNITEHLR